MSRRKIAKDPQPLNKGLKINEGYIFIDYGYMKKEFKACSIDCTFALRKISFSMQIFSLYRNEHLYAFGIQIMRPPPPLQPPHTLHGGKGGSSS
jgi:hypothetical protein